LTVAELHALIRYAYWLYAKRGSLVELFEV
jgi:hypothetical protein